jgi:RNA recognition motif-containing protein
MISNNTELKEQHIIQAADIPSTVFVADLPTNTSYLDLSEYFEKNAGPCTIVIKRPLFKKFYFAFICFTD